MAVTRLGRWGFTLVELMVSVAILSVLAAIAIPNYYNFTCKANQSEAKDILGVMVRCQEAYFVEYNAYSKNEDKIGFQTKGTPFYKYEIVSADRNGFKATATRYYGDRLDIWAIDQNFALKNEDNGCRK